MDKWINKLMEWSLRGQRNEKKQEDRNTTMTGNRTKKKPQKTKQNKKQKAETTARKKHQIMSYFLRPYGYNITSQWE